MRFISLAVALSASGATVVATTCSLDNCYHELGNPRISGVASVFCEVYTKVHLTRTVDLPGYMSVCDYAPTSISSACSCLFPARTTSTIRSASASPSASITSVSVTSSKSPSRTSSTSSSPASSMASSSVPTSTIANPTGSSSISASANSTLGMSSSSSILGAIPTSGPVSCPNDSPFSCHNATAVTDLCCFNYPGGSLLQTQFWDSNPSTGPADHWTIHGPDHCDGSYDQFCDSTREFTNITQILQSYGKTDLLAYMNIYWKDEGGDDESFWEHEWNKHGTCINTLDPQCYPNYQPQEEVADFFQKVVDLFMPLDTYSFLAASNVLPSNTQTYTAQQIYSALTSAYGQNVTIECEDGALDEVYYYYNVRGGVITGTYEETIPDDFTTSCPPTGIQYIPKYQNSTTSTTGTATSTSTTPSATSTCTPYNGKGYLQAYGDSQTGCLISYGTWYSATGTSCATYTGVFTDATNSSFTLKSSKGPCGIVADKLSCSANMTYTDFTSVNGLLANAAGDNQFYAPGIPTGSVQEPVYDTVNTTAVQFQWQAISC